MCFFDICRTKNLSSGPRRKHHASVVVCMPFPSNGRCTVANLAVVAWQRISVPKYEDVVQS
jgi:hypothetical protein